MRSREISLKSNMWHFQFSSWLNSSFERHIQLKWKPHLTWTSGSKVMSNWRILATENKRNSFCAVSHNQCSRLPTDSAQSQHTLYKMLQNISKSLKISSNDFLICLYWFLSDFVCQSRLVYLFSGPGFTRSQFDVPCNEFISTWNDKTKNKDTYFK